MNEAKRKLIAEARRQYHSILPCGLFPSLEQCFTIEENRIYFWFNSEDQSTHMIVGELADA